MKASEINEVAPILNRLIHRAIVNSVQLVVSKCKALRNKPQEPDFVASLTLNFSVELFNILKTLFPKNKFSVTGVYCHQKPLADIGVGKDPEIGDILFVYIYKDSTGSKKNNSLLLQAKISNKHKSVVPEADHHQLQLYTEWPSFAYKRAGSLDGTIRDILPKTINDGAQYLLIDTHPIFGLSGMSGTFPMGCAIPAKAININNDLTDEIIDFLKFKSGRAFEENPEISKDDWTKMIWDLLNVTKTKASKRKNAGLQNFPRQVVNNFDGCCYFMSDSDSIFKDLHNILGEERVDDNFQFFFDEDNFSPSVVLIESNEQSN